MRDFNKRLRVKLQDTARGDIVLSDYRVLGHDCVVFCLGYNSNVGTPKKPDVAMWFNNNFPEFLPNIESAKVNAKRSSFTVFSRYMPETKHIKEAQGMIPIVANCRFMEEELKQAWDVAQTEEGELVLTKVTSDSLDEIIQARRERMGTFQTRATASLKQVLGNLTDVQEGDDIQFFHMNKKLQGRVEKVDPVLEKIHVNANGEEMDISTYAITKVFKRREAEASKDDKLKKYYKSAYGPEFGEKLVD